MVCTVKFSYAQLEGWWIAHGGNPAAAPMAAAIALAESGGCVDATNHNPNGTTDSGLWQINSIHAPPAQMADPVANVTQAIAISANGTNWQSWSAFTNGAYRRFLAGTQPSSAFPAGMTPGASLAGWSVTPFLPFPLPFGPPGQGSLNPLQGFSDTAKSIVAFTKVIEKPFEWANAAAMWMANPHNWGRVLMVAAGTLILSEGLHLMVPAAPSAARSALKLGQAIPAGRAARAAAGAKEATMAAREQRRAATTRINNAAREAERRRTVTHTENQRRITAEHRSEQRITDREHAASTRRYGSYRPRPVPADEAGF